MLFTAEARQLKLFSSACLFVALAASGCTAQGVSVLRHDVVRQTLYTAGPPSGHAYAGQPLPEGLQAPFPGQPISGVSGGFFEDELLVTVLDNGFGLRENSADFFPRIVWWKFDAPGSPPVVVRALYLTDPQGFMSRGARGTPSHAAMLSRLSGAEIDPESIAPGLHGSYWIGDEFGPFLYHFSSRGELLEPPIEIPVPELLADYSRDQRIFISPDHPRFRHLGADAHKAANLPRSKGIEGLSRVPGADSLVLMMEGPLVDAKNQRLLPIISFDLHRRDFRLRGLYPMAKPHSVEPIVARHKIGDLLALSPDCYLVIEADEGHGVLPDRIPGFKRIMRALPSKGDNTLMLQAELILDLLNLPANRFNLNDFPFVTIEGIAKWSEDTIVIFNDDNFPSSGGRGQDQLDRTEFLWMQLPASAACPVQ